MKKRIERITDWYSVSIEDGIAVLHHSPRLPYYWANKERFQEQRREAYRQLAESGRTDIREVRGYSLTLDYERDGFTVTYERTQLARDRLSLVGIWLNNLYNWRPSRWWKLFRILRKKRVQAARMNWLHFVQNFGTEEITKSPTTVMVRLEA